MLGTNSKTAKLITGALTIFLFILNSIDAHLVRERCIEKCEEVTNGVTLHQSCSSCNRFIMCFQGTTTELDCGEDLVWDDQEKECLSSSTTCLRPLTTRSTMKACVSSCQGRGNGRYRSCKTCEAYVECRDGNLIFRICPSGQKYDDSFRQCVPTASDTCPQVPSAITSCVTSCANKTDGYFQSCTACNFFIACKNGTLSRRPCPASMLWDDNAKKCVSQAYCFLDV